MAETMHKFMPDVVTIDKVHEDIKNCLKNTGLADEGVTCFVHNGTKEHDKELRDILERTEPSQSKLNKILKERIFNQTKYGANACYIDKTKTIVISEKGLHNSVYHEIGHALNANTNIFTKMLQKARNITPFGVSLAAPVLLAVGLAHNVDKTKPKEQKDNTEKALDFVANNAGKLTLASYIPLVGEEGLASIRGVNMIRKFMPAKDVNKIAYNYLKALGTYAGVAAMVSGGVGLGVMVANKIKNHDSSK